MLQKLAAQKPPFVHYEKHHGARLTAAGKTRALEVLRHHRLLERFLHDVLDYSWDEVHDEAERLEHFISERLEDRIAAKLGDPETDPHGHLIPERNGALPARQEVPLSNWACGMPAVISSVSDRDAKALREMKRLGLKPGTAITVESGDAKDGAAGPSRQSRRVRAFEPDSRRRNLGNRRRCGPAAVSSRKPERPHHQPCRADRPSQQRLIFAVLPVQRSGETIRPEPLRPARNQQRHARGEVGVSGQNLPSDAALPVRSPADRPARTKRRTAARAQYCAPPPPAQAP